MELGILGPLVVSDPRGVRMPQAPKQRQLLALLVANANHVVTVGECVEELWDGAPPASAVQTLQTYVMKLRKSLPPEPDGSTRIHTRDQGYVFRTRPGELDLERYETEVRAARAAAAGGADELAAARFAAALRIWRGEALEGLALGPVLRTTLVGVTESRLGVLEQRIEADLRLGRHHELLGELRMLTARHTGHENLAAQFMVAFYRCGRQADALAAFQRLRAVLTEQLGVEPSPRMNRLHHAVLTTDPVLDPPRRSAAPMALDLADAPIRRAS
ncbi:hypothetical protein GCM10009836_35300 [Pseudonocardia ailaonensis]|uniref:OmpR/PhoB-type domain-containing protein n=1 Tax=Pseudonocardia ailaonensis TaxID=367279 RepID=A0ABN2N6V9_9PSEU